MHIRNR